MTPPPKQVKLESITGIPYSAQVLHRFASPDDVGKEGSSGVAMNDDVKTLADEGVKEWECISVSSRISGPAGEREESQEEEYQPEAAPVSRLPV
jgi:hypothetical protein